MRDYTAYLSYCQQRLGLAITRLIARDFEPSWSIDIVMRTRVVARHSFRRTRVADTEYLCRLPELVRLQWRVRIDVLRIVIDPRHSNTTA